MKLIGWFGLAVLFVTQSQGQIMSGEERDEMLSSATALLSNSVDPVDPAALAEAPSPFQADLGIVVAQEVKKSRSVELSEEELLAELAKSIVPTGIFKFGGEYFLVFNERKIKSNSTIGVMYQGTEYGVAITDVTDNAYVVGLGESRLKLKLQ